MGNSPDQDTISSLTIRQHFLNQLYGCGFEQKILDLVGKERQGNYEHLSPFSSVLVKLVKKLLKFSMDIFPFKDISSEFFLKEIKGTSYANIFDSILTMLCSIRDDNMVRLGTYTIIQSFLEHLLYNKSIIDPSFVELFLVDLSFIQSSFSSNLENCLETNFNSISSNCPDIQFEDDCISSLKQVNDKVDPSCINNKKEADSNTFLLSTSLPSPPLPPPLPNLYKKNTSLHSILHQEIENTTIDLSKNASMNYLGSESLSQMKNSSELKVLLPPLSIPLPHELPSLPLPPPPPPPLPKTNYKTLVSVPFSPKDPSIPLPPPIPQKRQSIPSPPSIPIIKIKQLAPPLPIPLGTSFSPPHKPHTLLVNDNLPIILPLSTLAINIPQSTNEISVCITPINSADGEFIENFAPSPTPSFLKPLNWEKLPPTRINGSVWEQISSKDKGNINPSSISSDSTTNLFKKLQNLFSKNLDSTQQGIVICY